METNTNTTKEAMQEDHPSAHVKISAYSCLLNIEILTLYIYAENKNIAILFGPYNDL